MVLQSGSLPLHIYPAKYTTNSYRPGGRRPEAERELYQFILKQLPCFSTAHLKHPFTLCSPSPAPEVLQIGTTKLQSLRVSSSEMRISHVVIFPNITFPHLRNLRLDCPYISLRSFGKEMLHPGLHRLELSTTTSPNHLLAMLAPMQSLVHLILRNAFSPGEEDLTTGSNNTPTSQRYITLPCLQLLDISISEYFADNEIYVFQHIVYPATTSVRLQLKCGGSRSPRHDFIGSVIRQENQR